MTDFQKARNTRITFGQYKGNPLWGIPKDYLLWVLKTVGGKRKLKTAIGVYLGNDYLAKHKAKAYRRKRYDVDRTMLEPF